MLLRRFISLRELEVLVKHHKINYVTAPFAVIAEGEANKDTIPQPEVGVLMAFDANTDKTPYDELGYFEIVFDATPYSAHTGTYQVWGEDYNGCSVVRYEYNMAEYAVMEIAWDDVQEVVAPWGTDIALLSKCEDENDVWWVEDRLSQQWREAHPEVPHGCALHRNPPTQQFSTEFWDNQECIWEIFNAVKPKLTVLENAIRRNN